MPIKSQYLNHPIALSVGVGLYKGNPLAIVFQVSDDGARPIGISSADVVLDGTNYKINVSERFYADWIPAEIRVKNLFKTPHGVLVALLDGIDVDVSDIVKDDFVGSKGRFEGFITLWTIPKVFVEDTIPNKEITYKQIGSAVETLFNTGVVPMVQDTIQNVKIDKKPTGNGGVTLTPANS